MKCTYTIRTLVTLLLLCTVSDSIAQEELVEPEVNASIGLSGIVEDTEGKPIPGFTFAIQSTQHQNGMIPPEVLFIPQFQVQLVNQPGVPRRIVRVKTDADGTFSATNIQPGFMQINPIPKALFDVVKKKVPDNLQLPEQMHKDMIQRNQMNIEMMRIGRMRSDMQILSIQLNKVAFYYMEDGPGPFQGLFFGLKPGTNIENVKITVKKKLKIRAQIVYADGTPMVNADARLSMRYRGGEFGFGNGTHGTSCYTDAEGYFTEYREEQGYYTLSITYKEFSGGAGPFLLTKDEHPEKIVIKLDGNPVVPKRPTGDVKKIDHEKARSIVSTLFNKNNVVRKAIVPQQVKPVKLVWVINPANGHAYARISCQDWHDAQRKAIEENSHLVSINDEDEQFWIEIIFGGSQYWIGLNDVEEEGLWKWDSGEPVTYTNWSTRNMYPDDSPESEKDYVAVTYFEGGWQSASPKGHLWRAARSAIIEKDGMVSKIPELKEEPENE